MFLIGQILNHFLLLWRIKNWNAKLELKEAQKMLSESREKLDDSENTIVKLSDKR